MGGGARDTADARENAKRKVNSIKVNFIRRDMFAAVLDRRQDGAFRRRFQKTDTFYEIDTCARHGQLNLIGIKFNSIHLNTKRPFDRTDFRL